MATSPATKWARHIPKAVELKVSAANAPEEWQESSCCKEVTSRSRSVPPVILIAPMRHHPAFFAMWFRSSGSARRAYAVQAFATFSRASFLTGSVVWAASFLAWVARRQ